MFGMEISEREDWLVLSARGDLDLSSAPRLATALSGLPHGAERVVVDLSRVDLVDATGIGLLVGLQQRLAHHGGRLVLAGCPSPLVDRLAEGGMGGVFESVDSVAAVVGAPHGWNGPGGEVAP